MERSVKGIAKLLYWLSLVFLLMIPVSLVLTAGAYGGWLPVNGAGVFATLVNSTISNLFHAGLLLGLSRVISLLEKLLKQRDESEAL